MINIVNTIIVKENKILMLKRSFEPKNKLDILGGFVDKGEEIEAAAIREAKEESGFDIQLKEKLGIFSHQDPNKQFHVFIGEIISGELTSSEEGEPQWIPFESLNKENLAFPKMHISVLNLFFNKNQLNFKILIP